MNHFTVKAHNFERQFVKKVKAGATYRTGNGAPNTIVSVEGDVIYLRTKRSKQPFRLTRKQMHKAIAFLLENRIATRKDVEKCNKYSSALMGILRLVFAQIARIKRTIRGLLQIRLNDVRYVFSGLARAPRDMSLVKAFGGVEILVSYFHAREDRESRWHKLAKRLNLRVMADSGEFSRYKAEAEGKATAPILVEDYAEFLIRHQDVITSAISLDRIGQPEESNANFEYLRKQGLNVIPVWHCQSPWDALEELVRQDHQVIAIGGSAFLSTKQRRVVFDELYAKFPNQAFHLLGGTSPVISQYPWFSSDSTSWLNARKCGRLVTPRLQMKMPEEWSSVEGLAFNIEALATMEGNYTRTYPMPIPVKPDVRDWERRIADDGIQTRLFA